MLSFTICWLILSFLYREYDNYKWKRNICSIVVSHDYVIIIYQIKTGKLMVIKKEPNILWNTVHPGWCRKVSFTHMSGGSRHSVWSVSQLWTNETKPFKCLPLPRCQTLMSTSNEVSSNYKTQISHQATASHRNTKKSEIQIQVFCRINLRLMLWRTDVLQQELNG